MNPIGTLLHERAISVGADDEGTGWLGWLGLNLLLRWLRLSLRGGLMILNRLGDRLRLGFLSGAPSCLVLNHLLHVGNVGVNDLLHFLHLCIGLSSSRGWLGLLKLDHLVVVIAVRLLHLDHVAVLFNLHVVVCMLLD